MQLVPVNGPGPGQIIVIQQPQAQAIPIHTTAAPGQQPNQLYILQSNGSGHPQHSQVPVFLFISFLFRLLAFL